MLQIRTEVVLHVNQALNVHVALQYVEDNLGVMSVGFLLASPDDAVIWRGPKKNGKCTL